jgi:O-antigen ligase
MEIVNNIFSKDKRLTVDSLSFLLAFFSVIIIPVYYWFLPPLMILWGIICFFEIKNKIRDFSQATFNYKLLFVLFITFFIWQLIGLLYSENSAGGWRNIVLRLSLFLFPLVLISPGEIVKQKGKILLKSFAISTFIYIMVCFGYALYRSFHVQNGNIIFNPHLPVYTWLNYFYGTDFAIFQHPSYLSMFIIFSVYIALEELFNKTVIKIRKVLWLIVCLILLSAIYLLSSRAGMLATIISLPLYFLFKFRNNAINKYMGAGIFLIILILLVILISNPRLHDYFKNESKTELIDKTLKESRLDIWKATLNIIKNNFVFGVGTGDIQDQLNKEYKRLGNTELIGVKNLNSHNQYLEVIAEHGLVGLILFLSMIGVMILIAISEKNILYIMFILIVIFSFIFETMLNRLAGVSFFSLFAFLLLHVNTQKVSDS